jgi:hypothetical protein
MAAHGALRLAVEEQKARIKKTGKRMLSLLPKRCPNFFKNITSTPSLRGRCEIFGIQPLTLLSPREGNGNPVEMKIKFPPP